MYTTRYSYSTIGGIAALITASVLMLLTSTAVSAQGDGQWRLRSGVDYSVGDYGSDPFDTEITYLPFTASYRSGNWEYSASFSHMTIEGAGTVLAGEGIIPDRPGVGRGGAPGTPQPQVVSTSQSGTGDIWLEASYFVDSLPTEAFYLELSGRAKIPTADESRGLGTGAADYTLQAELTKPLGGMTPFLTLGYKFKGDPDFIELDDVPFVSVGSDFTLSGASSVGFALDFQPASFQGGSDYRDLLGYFNHELSSSWDLTLYGYKGLADGSPDYGVGMQLNFALGRR